MVNLKTTLINYLDILVLNYNVNTLKKVGYDILIF